jgi:hypothetical protein
MKISSTQLARGSSAYTASTFKKKGCDDVNTAKNGINQGFDTVQEEARKKGVHRTHDGTALVSAFGHGFIVSAPQRTMGKSIRKTWSG